jgi:hypothetical protein
VSSRFFVKQGEQDWIVGAKRYVLDKAMMTYKNLQEGFSQRSETAWEVDVSLPGPIIGAIHRYKFPT